MAKSTPRRKTVKAKPKAAGPKRIAIVGKAPSSRALAPFSDDEWEIWTLSTLVAANEVPRYDRHFEIHPLDGFINRGDNYWEWMKSVRDKPIYTQELHPEIPAAVLFPKREIVQQFGTYFTNSVSWMLAYAISLKPEQIHVYGVDMAQNDEYASQRPSCEFFLGWAAGAGIEIHIPSEADLLKARNLYGFDTDSGEMRDKCKVRRKELDQRIANQNAKAKEAHEQAIYLSGAREAMDWTEQWQ